MNYRIEFTSAAAKQIKKLPHSASSQILKAIESLQDNPHPHRAKKPVGEATAWRIRVGNYRVIYDIFDEELVVTVVRAAHRREAYR